MSTRTIFWVGAAGGAAIGVLGGLQLGFVGRQLLFPAVVAAAAWVLVFVLRADAERPDDAALQPGGRHSALPLLPVMPDRVALPAGENRRDLVGELLVVEGQLRSDAAREWLDAFLVQHQKKQ